jgi:hypothetical protein
MKPMIPYRMMWLSEQFASFTRENPKASLQPELGARRATAPMRRRQDLPFSWEVAAGSHPDTLGLACDRTPRLPVTDCNAPETASMALTNAEKQARYRERTIAR